MTPNPTQSGKLFARRWLALPLVGIFLALLSSRLLLIRGHAFAHPYWDQWHSEGIALIQPWLEGDFHFIDLFAPNSEHRIALTRLIQLALISLDGQWDGISQVVANALVYSLLGTGFLASLWRTGESPAVLPVVLLFAVVFALPIGWANALWGFQSQFYFLIFLSLYAITGTSRSLPFAAGWWVAYGAAFLGFLGMAGGILTPVACGAIQTLRALQSPNTRKAHGLAAFAWLGLGIVLFLWTPQVPGSTVKAGTFAEFGVTLLKNVAFPFADPLLSIPLILIGFAAASVALRSRARVNLTPLDLSLIGFLIWTFGQSAAIAYSRGAGAPAPTHRYFDVISLFAPIGIALLWRMPVLFGLKSPASVIVRISAIALFIVSGMGLAGVVRNTFKNWLPQHDAEFALHEANLRDMILTSDYGRLGPKSAQEIGSYLSADSMRTLLSASSIRRVLAPSIRKPLQSQEGLPDIIEPSDLAIQWPNWANLPQNHLSIVNFESKQTPGLWLQWHALRCGVLLTVGPAISGSTRYSLILPGSFRQSPALYSLLSNLDAQKLTAPRSIGPIGALSRFLATSALVVSSLALITLVGCIFLMPANRFEPIR
jgi:hypothetical protein